MQIHIEEGSSRMQKQSTTRAYHFMNLYDNPTMVKKQEATLPPTTRSPDSVGRWRRRGGASRGTHLPPSPASQRRRRPAAAAGPARPSRPTMSRSWKEEVLRYWLTPTGYLRSVGDCFFPCLWSIWLVVAGCVVEEQATELLCSDLISGVGMGRFGRVERWLWIRPGGMREDEARAGVFNGGCRFHCRRH